MENRQNKIWFKRMANKPVLKKGLPLWGDGGRTFAPKPCWSAGCKKMFHRKWPVSRGCCHTCLRFEIALRFGLQCAQRPITSNVAISAVAMCTLSPLPQRHCPACSLKSLGSSCRFCESHPCVDRIITDRGLFRNRRYRFHCQCRTPTLHLPKFSICCLVVCLHMK